MSTLSSLLFFKIWSSVSQSAAADTWEQTECVLKDTSSRKWNKFPKHLFVHFLKAISIKVTASQNFESLVLLVVAQNRKLSCDLLSCTWERGSSWKKGKKMQQEKNSVATMSVFRAQCLQIGLCTLILLAHFYDCLQWLRRAVVFWIYLFSFCAISVPSAESRSPW